MTDTAQAPEHQLPPLKSLLKGNEVEDPINIYVHRTAAYAFVWSIFKTNITPNMVTLMSVIAGVLAGAMFLWGERGAMIAGGILLWSAAILDGADGILARAKKMQSQFGRALDGWADMMVAIFTVFPAFYHIWATHHDVFHLWLMVPAIALTAVHLWLYDYYKESYLRMTRLDKGGEGEDPEKIAKMVDEAREKGVITYIAVKHVLMPYLETQARIIALLNPLSRRQDYEVRRSEQTAEIYRKYNQWPMRLWTIVSLAPHSYLMAWCAMADRLDIYLWVRVAFMNSVFVLGLFWQRWATQRTLAEYEAIGAVEYLRGVPAGREALATDA